MPVPERGLRAAIVHDYLTQRGGAERVVLELAAALPGAPVHTSLYDPAGTFPEFGQLDVRPSPLDALAVLRRHHRLALPVLAPTFSRLRLDAEVVVCSSSGWAHGTRVSGRKIVYCHAPARWLYQTSRYLGERHRWARRPAELGARPLRRWDQAAARSAHRYLVNSGEVRRRVAEVYGLDAEVLPPPPGFAPDGPTEPLAGVEPGFVLCVARLLEYKNVAPLVEAFRARPGARLVLAGGGPLLAQLRRSAPANVTIAGRVADPELRWLYRSCAGLVAPSYEDFGLTPLEAASFGKATAALRFGGYLDTVVEGATGLFFDEPLPAEIGRAVDVLLAETWSPEVLARHTERFSPARFVERIRVVVDEELALG